MPRFSAISTASKLRLQLTSSSLKNPSILKQLPRRNFDMCLQLKSEGRILEEYRKELGRELTRGGSLTFCKILREADGVDDGSKNKEEH